MKLLCRLFGHCWRVRQPISFLPFDQGGLYCTRCWTQLSPHDPRAARIAEENNL